MILLHIINQNRPQAEAISDMLLKEKLILDAQILFSEKRKLGIGQLIDISNEFIIIGKTKALLFDTIDKVLREKFDKNIPTIYAMPIVNMDWDQASELKESIEKI